MLFTPYLALASRALLDMNAYDIGCGGGIDTVIAAQRTGPLGAVIGLDFLPEMLDRTRRAAREAGLNNVQTLEGEMEAIPRPDDSVDLVISNGVINLSARKARVMAECARVLRPGGRLCVSDLTVEQKGLPPKSSHSPQPGPAASRARWLRRTSCAS